MWRKRDFSEITLENIRHSDQILSLPDNAQMKKQHYT
jgi:hypothetical protein